MMRYEYRLERLFVAEDDRRIGRLLGRLDEQAPKGWRVAGLDLGLGPSGSSAYVSVLLERSLEDDFPKVSTARETKTRWDELPA